MLTAVNSLVCSGLDYCNVIFYGLPNKTLKKFQIILNRSLRLIRNLPKYSRTTPLMIEHHWLPIKARIEFKICLLVFKVLKFKNQNI